MEYVFDLIIFLFGFAWGRISKGEKKSRFIAKSWISVTKPVLLFECNQEQLKYQDHDIIANAKNKGDVVLKVKNKDSIGYHIWGYDRTFIALDQTIQRHIVFLMCEKIKFTPDNLTWELV